MRLNVFSVMFLFMAIPSHQLLTVFHLGLIGVIVAIILLFDCSLQYEP